MATSSSGSWTKSFFVGIWNVLNFSRKLLFNIIFLIIVLAIIIAIASSDKDKVIVSPDSALILDLSGDIVIQKQFVDPVQKFTEEALGQEPENPEILLRHIVQAIENAKEDKRIKIMVLQLGGMGSAGLDKLRIIANAIDDFKTSGKPVYAIGDYFFKQQYYLAAHADKIMMNPMGALIIEGYERYRLYYKDMLDNLKISTHVFKVGKFKSAIEPDIRNDMSDEAKLANMAWLTSLWSQYKVDVASARGIELTHFDESMAILLDKIEKADGDLAEYALQNGWVDTLASRNEVREEMISVLGKADTDEGFNSIYLNQYINILNPPLPELPATKPVVAIVVAKGTILDGNKEPGTIGGDSTGALLRKARLDDNVKAVILQVDSGGGSVFGSEVIRKEVDLIRQAGKPIIASMSTYAASGGYWISASTDMIVASPSTITGSIGIFGMLRTFEGVADYIGVNYDGVGTSEVGASKLSPLSPLDPSVSQLVQMNIEKGYDRFITLVATERNMTKEAVDEVAQGRVWTGEKAKELGLVDKLGTLDDAVIMAAEMASLESYETRYVEKSLTPQQLFMKNLFQSTISLTSGMNLKVKPNQFMSMFKMMSTEMEQLSELNDPMNSYVLCLDCNVK